MLKILKNSISDFIYAFKIGYKTRGKAMDVIETDRFNDISICKNPLAVIQYKYKYAALTHAMTALGNKYPVIVIDNRLDNFDDDGKRFILAHEQGHLIYDHLSDMSNYNISFEFDADKFAMALTSRAIAKRTLKQMYDESASFKGRRQLKKRIENISVA